MFIKKSTLNIISALFVASCMNTGQPETPQPEVTQTTVPGQVLSAPSETVPTPPQILPKGADRQVDWGALFIAGDHSIKAFDNATRRFYAIIERNPNITLRRLTSDPNIAPSREDIADVDTIDSALHYVAQDAKKCLVFMTSHGNEDGFYLSQANGTGSLLPPRVLDQWLNIHCSARPTVVIVSACYSGIFLKDGMQKPNRIIFTAARDNRPSFGCGAGEVYTYYDKCLLDSWTWVYTWRELYDRTKVCVTERETELGTNPSEPQAFFGADVANLEMP